MLNTVGLSNETIRSALSFLDYDDTDIWLMAGMAIRSELGDDGFEMWNTWSSYGATYDLKNAKARWRSFKSGRGVTIGSLIHHAQNLGFKLSEYTQRVSPHVIQQREERRKQLEIEAQIEEQRTKEQQAKSANKAQWIWDNAPEAVEHPYLLKKDVCAHGLRLGEWKYKDGEELRTESNALLVPLYSYNKVVSLQAIFPDGTKKLMYGAMKRGVYSPIGEPTHTILICEGWATGATLYESTQLYTLVAIDAGNLEHVARYARRAYPLSRIVICADNDQYNKSNTGIKSANKAACAIDADVVYPVFSNLETKPTDFNDLYHEAGSSAVYDRVITPTLYFAKSTKDVEAFSAFDLPYIDDSNKVLEESQYPLDVARAALVVAMRMSEKVPAFMTVEQIRKFIAHPLIHHETHTSIMCRVQWAIQNRKRMAMTAVRPQSWGKHEHVVVSDLSQYKVETPVSLIFAPMGAGKTRKVITPFSKIADKTFCAIAHRRSLIADLSKKLDITSYEDVTLANVDEKEKVAVCLPSTQSFAMKPFINRVVNVAIDEISQNIRFTSSKECKVAGANQEAIFLGLKKLVNEAHQVIAADASIDQTTLDFFQQARPDEKFTIVEMLPNNSRQRKCFLYGDRADLLTKVEVELQNGGNVWFSVESAERAEVLRQIFESKYKTLAITSKNSKTKEIKSFLDNIEEQSRDYRLVIASPAISSGVSVEHSDGKHFTMIAGMASGHSICFSDFAQMLGRVRYVDHYHVYLQENNKRFEHVNASSVLLGLRQASELEGKPIKENEYSQFKAHIEVTEEMYRADFANGFCWFLEYYCFELVQGLVPDVDYSLSEKMKELSAEMKATYRLNLRSADKITAQKAIEIDNKQEQTDEEYFQLIAYKLRSSLGFSIDYDIDEPDIDMFENMATLDRFARYMGKAFEYEDADVNISLRRFHNAQIKATERLFNGLDLRTAFFDDALCQDIISRVCSNDNRFLLSSLKLVPSKYGQWKESKSGELLDIKTPSQCGKATAQILEKFGLHWRRTSAERGHRGYRVTEESFNKMQTYAERRYAKVQNVV